MAVGEVAGMTEIIIHGENKMACKLKNCKYIDTEGCRVKGLGVTVIECIKYKKKEKK